MRQSERRKQSSDRLIHACLELAAEEGIAALTFDNIGLRAGYSRNLAFQKFGSKSGLLEAVISYLHDLMEDIRAESDLEAISGMDALLLYCDVHIRSQSRDDNMRAYFVLMSEAISTLSDMRALFAQSHERSATELTRLFTRGVADRSIRKDVNIRSASLSIGTQLIGISCQSLIDPNFDLSQAGKELHHLLISTYAADPA